MTAVLWPTRASEQRDKLLTLGHASVGVGYVLVNELTLNSPRDK